MALIFKAREAIKTMEAATGLDRKTITAVVQQYWKPQFVDELIRETPSLQGEGYIEEGWVVKKRDVKPEKNKLLIGANRQAIDIMVQKTGLDRDAITKIVQANPELMRKLAEIIFSSREDVAKLLSGCPENIQINPKDPENAEFAVLKACMDEALQKRMSLIMGDEIDIALTADELGSMLHINNELFGINFGPNIACGSPHQISYNSISGKLVTSDGQQYSFMYDDRNRHFNIVNIISD